MFNIFWRFNKKYKQNNKYIRNTCLYISQNRPILNVFTNLKQKGTLCDINYIFGDQGIEGKLIFYNFEIWSWSPQTKLFYFISERSISMFYGLCYIPSLLSTIDKQDRPDIQCGIYYSVLPCTILYRHKPLRTTPYYSAPSRVTRYHTIPPRTTPYVPERTQTIPYHSAPPRITSYHREQHRTTPYHHVPLRTIPYHFVPTRTTP